jgi:hypothetical protein
MEKPVTLTTSGRKNLTTHCRSHMFVVQKCMLSFFRPDFEVVKEGRILQLGIGYDTNSKSFEGF